MQIDRVRLAAREAAQGLTEYGLIVAFAALAGVGGLITFGDALGANVGGTFAQVATAIRPIP